MQIRDRIRELRRVPANQLRPNPKNWRTHPDPQRDALRGVLAEIGYADALLTRELPDGTLELIDGHLRAETTPEMEVPVLIVDLTDEEADKLLAVHDPLAAMAETDDELLAELVATVETENEALRELLAQPSDDPLPDIEPIAPTDLDIPESYQVVVECDDEIEQKSLYEQLTAEGFKCRLLTL